MKKKNEKCGFISIKVNMQKAFNRVEWNMLCRILNALSLLVNL